MVSLSWGSFKCGVGDLQRSSNCVFIKGKIEDGGGRENKREKMRGERGERGEREEKEEGGDHKNF